MERRSDIERNTNETKIKMKLNIDGTGKSNISTGVGFFDHMLAQVVRHGFLDLDLDATGDIHVDSHHLVEDVGIVLGKGFSEAIGDKKGITRYGDAIVPMDDALVLVAIDFSGRPFLGFDVTFSNEKIGDFDTELVEEFFRAVSVHGGMNLHIKMLSGNNCHHIAEGIFKGFGRAVSKAVQFDKRIEGTLSTKGLLE